MNRPRRPRFIQRPRVPRLPPVEGYVHPHENYDFDFLEYATEYFVDESAVDDLNEPDFALMTTKAMFVDTCGTLIKAATICVTCVSEPCGVT